MISTTVKDANRYSKVHIRSSAVAVIADRVVCVRDVRYSFVNRNNRGQQKYLLFSFELHLVPVSFFVLFATKRYILQQKCMKKWIGSCLLGTPLSTLYTDPECHNTPRHRRTDGQRNRQMTVWSCG